MVRKPSHHKPHHNSIDIDGPTQTTSERRRIIDAFMELLAEQPIEKTTFDEIATRANLSLMQLREEFGSKIAILAAHFEEIDRKVLAGKSVQSAERPSDGRLFDVLMRRFEALAPHKPAIHSLLRSSARNPLLTLALNRLAVRSQRWMLTAVDIDAAGPRGTVRAQGLALVFAHVLPVWLDDEDPRLSHTSAALGRYLRRGQRWSSLLGRLCRLPARYRAGTRRYSHG